MMVNPAPHTKFRTDPENSWRSANKLPGCNQANWNNMIARKPI